MAFGEYCYLEQTHKATWKRTQRRPTMLGLVASVCYFVRSFIVLTGFKLCATKPNNIQQHAIGCPNGRNM